MKRTVKFFLALAAAALTLAGCQKTENEQLPQDGLYKYSFAIVEDGTRAEIGDNSIEWVSGDQVGIFISSIGDYTGFKGYAKVDVETSPKSVVLYSTSAIPAGAKVYAYAPYDADNKNKDAAEVKIVLNNVQTGAKNSAMPLAGLPFEVEEEIDPKAESGNGEIRFANLGSLINFKIFSTNVEYQSETIKSIQFESTKTIAGVGHIDLTAVDMNDEGTLELVMDTNENTVKVNEEMEVAADKESADPIKMVILPGVFQGTLTVVTDAATYTKAIPEREFARSHSRTFGLDLDKAERSEGVEETVVTLPYSETFESNIGKFEINNISKPDYLAAVWSYDSNYKCMKATAYVNGSRYETESMLVSPWIDLTDVSAAAISFDAAYNFVNNPSEFLTLWVLTDETDAEWAKLTIEDYGTGSFAWASNEIDISEYVNKKVKIAFKYTSTESVAATWEIKNFRAYILKADPELSFETTEFEAEVSGEFIAPTLVNPHNLIVSYSTSNGNIALVDETSGEVVIGDVVGTATITASFAGNDDYREGTASYSIKVTDPTVTSVTDVINRAFTGLAAGANYTAWSGKTGTSGAIYAGNSAAYNTDGADAIQMRSNNNNSGIVTTGSGGHVSKVTVVWNSATGDRTLDVYGKSSAYESASDLYDNAKQGTLLGSIVKGGSSTSLDISGDYTFIGLRSRSGAMYINEIQIEWSTSAPVVTTYSINLNSVDNGTIEANFSEAEAGTTVTLTATPYAGYYLRAWSVADDDDNVIEVNNDRFVMPESDVYVSATFDVIPEGQTYTLINSLTDLTEDTYIIAAYNININKYYAVPNTTISGQTFNCIEGMLDGTTLTPGDESGEFVLSAVSGVDHAFYIYNTTLGKYLVATGSKTFGYVDNTSGDYGYWIFSTVSSGGFSGQFSIKHSDKTHYMRAYNNTVRCYDGQSNNGIYLFKKDN